jgi:hypothetical protein
MPSRTLYRLRVLSILGAAFGPSTSPEPASAAIGRAQVEQLSVSEKLAQIRQATSAALEQARESGVGEDHKKLDEIFTAQWFNWGNWRNWANWANWANWLNWFN